MKVVPDSSQTQDVGGKKLNAYWRNSLQHVYAAKFLLLSVAIGAAIPPGGEWRLWQKVDFLLVFIGTIYDRNQVMRAKKIPSVTGFKGLDNSIAAPVFLVVGLILFFLETSSKDFLNFLALLAIGHTLGTIVAESYSKKTPW